MNVPPANRLLTIIQHGSISPALMTPPQPEAVPAGAASEKTDTLDVRRRRLLFRSTHRGTHEVDILLGGFVAPRIAGFSEAELTALEAVMDLPDVDLADWLCGRLPLPPEHDGPMLRAIIEAAGR
jgi:antitoxin CptB